LGRVDATRTLARDEDVVQPARDADGLFADGEHRVAVFELAAPLGAAARCPLEWCREAAEDFDPPFVGQRGRVVRTCAEAGRPARELDELQLSGSRLATIAKAACVARGVGLASSLGTRFRDVGFLLLIVAVVL